MSFTRVIQNLIFMFCTFHLVLGDQEGCRYDLCDHHDCIQFRCPINTCGNFSSFENLICVCKNSTTTSDIKQPYGCVVINITADYQEYEVSPCRETHPFICSDFNNNFQIYAEENRSWTDAVKTCEDRHLHIAQVNLCNIHHTSNTIFWIGSFYSAASTTDIDVSQCQMTFDSQDLNDISTDTYVRCKIQPDMSRMTTNSTRPTSVGVTQTGDEGPNKELTTDTKYVTQMTGGSHEDSNVSHSNIAVIVGAISGGVVIIIIGVAVVYIRKIRDKRKPPNHSIQMSDIVGLARYTDQSLRGRPQADGQPQNPIYLPKHGSSYNGIGNCWYDADTKLDDESNYDHFEKAKKSSDIETENDTYDHTRLDIQVDSNDGYGVLHQKKAGMIDGVYDHVGSLAEGTYGHLHQKDDTSRPGSDTYDHNRST